MKDRRKKNPPVIMIAEMDAEERSILRAVAKFLGSDVMEATHRDQLIFLCRQSTPDLLVINLELPHLGGNDAVNGIRSDLALPRLPVVAVGSKGAAGKVRLPRRSAAFLPKPVDLEKLYFLIDRLLPGRLRLARS
jgi:CheY-like chemotaxis protein